MIPSIQNANNFYDIPLAEKSDCFTLQRGLLTNPKG